jgi:hypothetical protein
VSYLKINNNDYSNIVNTLVVDKTSNYTAQTNAAGDSVVDYINAKRTVEVGIIPLKADTMAALLADLELFNVSITFRNPLTNELETINTIIPDTNISYYTIQQNKVMYNALTLKFIEL